MSAFWGMWLGTFLQLPQDLDIVPLIMLFMECGNYLANNIDMESLAWKGAGVCCFFFWIYLVFGKGIYIEIASRS